MNTINGLDAIKDLFSFPFRDPRWKSKFLMGSGLVLASSFVPLIPLLPLLGYCVRITRQAVADQVAQPSSQPPEGEQEPGENQISVTPTLPEWDQWNELFMDGLRQLGVLLVVNLPLIILMIVGFGAYFGILFTSITSAVAHQGSESAPVLLTLLSTGVIFITLGLTYLLLPVTYLFLPAASAHVAVNRRFGALFEVSRWFRVLRSNISGYLVLIFFIVGLYMLFMLVFQLFYFTFFCCFLFPIVASALSFYTTLMFYNVSGLAYAGGRS